MDKVVGVVGARSHLPQILREVREGQRYIITSRSKPQGVLLSVEELETLEVLADRELLRELIQAKEDIKKGRVTMFEDYFGE